MRTPTSLALCAALVWGCASNRRAFQPTERAQDRPSDGYTEARYDLSEGGLPEGAVKVWSRGAWREQTHAGHRTRLHVGFVIDNPGSGAITLDIQRVRLDSLHAAEPRQVDIGADAIDGETVVTGGNHGNVELEFKLPDDVDVGSLRGFRVQWTAASDAGTFSEYTTFARRRTGGRREFAYDYCYDPYYDAYAAWQYPSFGTYGCGCHPSLPVIGRPLPGRTTVRIRPR